VQQLILPAGLRSLSDLKEDATIPRRSTMLTAP
jgi:hypothetical protein